MAGAQVTRFVSSSKDACIDRGNVTDRYFLRDTMQALERREGLPAGQELISGGKQGCTIGWLGSLRDLSGKLPSLNVILRGL
jgi:hypothetical protein